MMANKKRSSHPKRQDKQYYVLFVYGDVEPHLHGPYSTCEERDEKAQELRRENGMEDGGIYWLSQDADVRLECGSYSGDFFHNIGDKP
jgi:hypothetical protein